VFDANIVTLDALEATSVRVAVDEVLGTDVVVMGVFGLMDTTSAGSAATAAVEAALTAAVFVPSFIFVVWLPRVVWFAAVDAPVGSGRLAAEIGCVTADPSTLRALPAVTVAEFPPWLIVVSHGVVFAVLPG
jgi:hypothetical protein